MKYCRWCETHKPVTEFHKNTAAKDGLYSCCKRCKYRNQHEHFIPKRKEIRRQDAYVKYGITQDIYNQMCEEQEGLCKICKKPPRSGRPLAIDHCHASGKVRGLLCDLCNLGIGSFRDDPDFLKSAAAYLESCLRGGSAPLRHPLLDSCLPGPKQSD